MAWVNPKLDWLTNPINPTSVDMNRIESNIDFINNEIETKKGAIVDALSGVGISTLLTDTHAAIASKIIAAEKTGIIITPSTVNQDIQKGIYDNGAGVVLGDADLTAPNIAYGKNIFGIVGEYETPASFETDIASTIYIDSTTSASTISSTFVKLKEFQMKLGGSIRISATVDRTGFATTQGAIYINGIQVATSTAYAGARTILYDAVVMPGDKIAVYVRRTAAGDGGESIAKTFGVLGKVLLSIPVVNKLI